MQNTVRNGVNIFKSESLWFLAAFSNVFDLCEAQRTSLEAQHNDGEL